MTPKTPASEAEVRESYLWLMRELSKHCDRVLDRFHDYGTTYAVAVEWHKGQQIARFASLMECEESHLSINQLVRENKMTRREVVRAYTRNRPSWA